MCGETAVPSRTVQQCGCAARPGSRREGLVETGTRFSAAGPRSCEWGAHGTLSAGYSAWEVGKLGPGASVP